MKTFFIPAENLHELVPDLGVCMTSDCVMVDGAGIGFIYRNTPVDQTDSGWRILAGDESEAYVDDPSNAGAHAVDSIVHSRPDVMSFLNAPFGSAFLKTHGG